MGRIPMKDEPPSLEELVKLYGHPLDTIEEIHADSGRRLAEAEAAGDAELAADIRKVLKQTQKVLDQYRRAR